MSDLKDPRLIYLKGLLFLACGCLSAGLLLFYAPALRTGFLLAICIWSFCRLYYLAFYVVENYVDGSYRFAGLVDFVKYAFRQRFGWKCPRKDDRAS
jgi:TM2 domain-containing membrane protein YozV